MLIIFYSIKEKFKISLEVIVRRNSFSYYIAFYKKYYVKYLILYKNYVTFEKIFLFEISQEIILSHISSILFDVVKSCIFGTYIQRFG